MRPSHLMLLVPCLTQFEAHIFIILKNKSFLNYGPMLAQIKHPKILSKKNKIKHSKLALPEVGFSSFTEEDMLPSFSGTNGFLRSGFSSSF